MSSLYRKCTCMRDMMIIVLGVCTDAKHEVSTLSRIISEGTAHVTHQGVDILVLYDAYRHFGAVASAGVDDRKLHCAPERRAHVLIPKRCAFVSRLVSLRKR